MLHLSVFASIHYNLKSIVIDLQVPLNHSSLQRSSYLILSNTRLSIIERFCMLRVLCDEPSLLSSNWSTFLITYKDISIKKIKWFKIIMEREISQTINDLKIGSNWAVRSVRSWLSLQSSLVQLLNQISQKTILNNSNHRFNYQTNKNGHVLTKLARVFFSKSY